MLEVDLTRRAKVDLTDIWHYIAANNLPAADRLVQRFTRVFARLARMPGLGEMFPGSLPGTRILTSGAYVIIYVALDDRIQISRIIHSARDWQSLLDDPTDVEE